jgi:hypothetical protein
MSKTLASLCIILSLFVVSSLHTIDAKRLLPQAQKTNATAPKVSSKGVSVSVKFRSDRNAIIATFTNLRIAKEISYSLSYKNSEGIEQYTESSVSVNEREPLIREIPFGTCSTDNICRYDTGITNAKFIVTTTLKNGRKVIKTFNLKVKK